MIKHIVFWKVSDPAASQAVYEKLDQMVARLKTIIPEIAEARVGCNYRPDDQFPVYTVCLDSVFKSKADLAVYADHPEHIKLRDYMNSVTGDRTVFDYEF